VRAELTPDTQPVYRPAQTSALHPEFLSIPAGRRGVVYQKCSRASTSRSSAYVSNTGTLNIGSTRSNLGLLRPRRNAVGLHG
jgi:hypothetical protein